MDFLIHRDDLQRALGRVQGIVEKRSTSPILSAVLVQAGAEGIRLVATDKAMTFFGDFAATVRATGEVAVDAANFNQIARVLPNDVVSIKLVDQRVEIRCGSSFFKLNGYAAADFPVTPPLDQSRVMRMDAKDLRRVIDQTLFSVAPEDNRYGLNGAHIEDIPGETHRVRVVSTDGNRLSWAQANYEGELGIGRKMLLPRKALSEIRKLVDGLEGEVELAFGERAGLLRFPGVMLHMRLLEADFPDYRQVLPSNFKRKVVVERDLFSEALRRVSVFAADSSKSVRFAFSGDGLVLTARKLDAGDAREELPIELSGEPITMGFNAHFIEQVLSVVPEGRVVIELGDTLSPCLVKSQVDDDALFVVMPVRLD
jgi:DNA polymerase III subunit beta